MNFKRSLVAIQNKKIKDLDNAKEYSTNASVHLTLAS